MFKNARIVSINTEQADYRTQKVEDRGKPEYVMSSSDLRLLMSTSPSKWINGFSLSASDSLEYGSLLDTLVLTPDDFEKRYILQPEKYMSKGMECPKCKSVSDSKKCRACGTDRVEVTVEKDWSNQSTTCSDWTAAQAKAGREVVDQKTLDKAVLAKKRLLADKEISQLLENADRQIWVEAEWHDEATGIVVRVRCLIDFACRAKTPFEKIIGDLKSTKDARVTPWGRWARSVGYDMQGAWNLDLFNAATNREVVNFTFILSESHAPFEVGRRLMEVDPLQPEMDDFTPGRSKYRRAMALYCQCLKTGKWPDYDSTDISSTTGWTRLSPDAYDEQRRMFEPKFQVAGEEPIAEGEANPDLIP